MSKSLETSWAAEVHASYQLQIANDVFPPTLEEALLWQTPGVDESGRSGEQQLAEFGLCTVTNLEMHPGVTLWPVTDGQLQEITDAEYREQIETHLSKNGLSPQSIEFVIKSASQEERRAGITLYAIGDIVGVNQLRAIG